MRGLSQIYRKKIWKGLALKDIGKKDGLNLAHIQVVTKPISADDITPRPIFIKLAMYAPLSSMMTLQLEFVKKIYK